MITERRLLKKSGKYTLIWLAGALFFWFVIYDYGICHAQTQTGYRIPARLDIGGGRMTGDMWCQYGTNGVRLKIGTQAVTQVGTVGVINGTNATGLPSLDFTYGGGSMSANFNSFNAVYIAGSQVGTSGALTGKLDAVDGVGTNNTFNNPTLAGVGTITASFGANGLVITPAEYASVNNATGELQAQITTATGSITNHTHTGSDGTTQVSHTNLTNKGTQTHTQIDDFIASKAVASGVASLDANSLVVQNPASGTSTPGASKIVMSDGTNKISDNWLSNNVTKLGTPTTDNISEGSTNLYYTNSRVNNVIGSSSIISPQVSPKITFTSPAVGQFLRIIDAQGNVENGTSSASVDFSAVTGSATASQLPLISGLLGSMTAVQSPLVFRLSGTTTEQAAGAFGQLYVQSSLVSASAGFGTLTTTSLVSYYKLEDLDDSFGLNNLTNYGTTTFVAGKYGNCATFNGTTQYLQTSVLSTATTNISMFGWVFIASASEARPFFNNGVDGADTDGYALGVGNTQMDNAGNNLVGHLHGMAWMNFATAIGTGWHHVGITRGTSTWTGYIDKVPCGTTFTNNPTAPTGNFTIGRSFITPSNLYYNEKIDDVVFYNKTLSAGEIIELYNNTWPDNYTQYSAKYKDPVNGNTVFEILTPGTVTTEASYIYNNATTTVWGLGTNTSVTGTTSGAYAGWSNRPIRVSAVDIGSSKEIKDNIKTIKIKPDLLDAESIAKQNYISGSRSAWFAANQSNYEIVVNESGTGSVAYIDYPAMESDYKAYIELDWASNANRNDYIVYIQKTHEKGFWKMYNSVTPKSWNPKENPAMTREGFVVEDMPDVVKGEDKQSIDMSAMIAYMSLVQQTLKENTVFALRLLKELTTGTVTQEQKDDIAYRLDVLTP